MTPNRLLLKTANVWNERVDLFFGQLFSKRGHVLPLAVVYRVEETLVADAVLPLSIRQVARMIEFRFKGFCPPILAMTGRAVFCEDCRRGPRGIYFGNQDGRRATDSGRANNHDRTQQENQGQELLH